MYDAGTYANHSIFSNSYWIFFFCINSANLNEFIAHIGRYLARECAKIGRNAVLLQQGKPEEAEEEIPTDCDKPCDR